MKKWICLSLFILLVTCTSAERQNKVILLQPFGDFPIAEAQIVLGKIRKINPDVVLRPDIAFPKEAFTNKEPLGLSGRDISMTILSKNAGS
jgi:hypothetical protein